MNDLTAVATEAYYIGMVIGFLIGTIFGAIIITLKQEQ